MTAVAPGRLRPDALAALLDAARPERVGRVAALAGLGVRVTGVSAALHDLLLVGEDAARAEVVAVGAGGTTVMPIDPLDGLRVGDPVRATGRRMTVPTGAGLLGRVLDGTGRPIDGRGPLASGPRVPVEADAPAAMERARIDTALGLGVRALDTMTPVGRGQRIGLFAGSGVGKSSLLSMIARGSDAEVTVIALIGERGREVREFLEDDLGPEGLARSVVVVSTADQPALTRARAAFTATRIAESFRDEGAHAVLMMDSLTRVAMAQREIGLSVGEPPATRGYPPSVFGLLARLLERAGTGPVGSVTGIYTVLVDGDDHNEPIADTARSILDGHVVLDRRLATSGHFPSIDVLGSVSRVASRVTTAEQRAAATALRRVLAARRDVQDLLDVGAYAHGANPRVDAAVAHGDAITAFLTQPMDDVTPAPRAWASLGALVARMGAV
ncbi:FliI/YscN family ATPase [Amnibacterium sp. CER49]|uniref:FliI/YscN family ATPase n=1 Tax=Amnibacterium sp. CER49 TaxID=3039161 RepID=UPI002448CE23|nr:FliI/YscN family ATPase [Amnibacterium sp. CER49]MDH2443857.1 FliI/YscN family ATPase [Amnibacterium sp. CER49]